jgi:hypothetical protein
LVSTMLAPMVRPDEAAGAAKAAKTVSSCIEPAGESPVGVSAGAPRSRVQRVRGEILGAERTVESLREEGANERAVTIRSEACSLDKSSAERRTGGPSQSCQGEGQGQRGKTGGRAGTPRGREHGTYVRLDAEQERPSSTARRLGEGPSIRQSRKGGTVERESEGLVVPEKTWTTRWREGALLWTRVRMEVSARA